MRRGWRLRRSGAGAALERAAVFESAGHGDFVGVLDVGAGGDAGGDARDGERGEAVVGFVGEVAGGGFAFDGGGCGEDEFGGFATGFESGEAGPEVGEAELVGADAVDG